MSDDTRMIQAYADTITSEFNCDEDEILRFIQMILDELGINADVQLRDPGPAEVS